jgi:hypothetical protein
MVTNTLPPLFFFDASKPITQALMMHEAIHAVRHVLSVGLGQPNIEDGDDEILPYVCNYVVEKIEEKVKILQSPIGTEE